MKTKFGVNPAALINKKQKNGHTMYDWVRRQKCFPAFCMRTLCGENAISEKEIAFLREKDCKIGLVIRDLTEAAVSGENGIQEAIRAVDAAKKLGAPQNVGIALFAEIKPEWSANHNWMISFARTISASGYVPGFIGNAQNHEQSAQTEEGPWYNSHSNGTIGQGSLYFTNGNLSVDVGWEGDNQLGGNALSTIYWSSSNTSVASVDYYSGCITAKNAGIATITARCALDSHNCATFEIWVKGKTPVFLIHGRTSHSESAWGIKTNIPAGKNNHFDPDINAVLSNGMKYTERISQHISSFEPNKGEADTDHPCNLGNELLGAGYKENINLFAFNYPNEDAVKHSAQKFKTYIDKLIYYVRTFGTDAMKACFYASRSDYDSNNYKMNIVGHGMGGLVARYYIENLYQDNHVDKLITICTPHWGCGQGNSSNFLDSDFHALCDHDLYFDSAMFGGGLPKNLDCNALETHCYNGSYTLTDELLYNRERNTKYYAIAGIDYPTDPLFQKNDYAFEISSNYITYQQFSEFMFIKRVYRYHPIEFNPKYAGDNMIGFLSQIGWTENSGSRPHKKIQMEKIFVDVDTDGGNGEGVFVTEILPDGSKAFHTKVNHRQPVCDKVIEYLEA